jgi:uncharacterized protein YndB with AHSA1/START domain
MNLDNLQLDVEQHIDIDGAIDEVFEAMLTRLGQRNTKPGDEPMPMVLERRPGGRWFRDLGDDTGHLWGFVQVFKPPTLLEITGPMFMSYPVAGHLSLRLTEVGTGTRVTLRHRVLGFVDEDHRKGVVPGWEHLLSGVKRDCEVRSVIQHRR